MKNDKIVTINGQKYDTATGLPIASPKTQPKIPSIKSPNTIRSVHSLAQRSQALYDRAAQKTASEIKAPIRKIGRSMDIARSKSVAHFAPHPAPKAVAPKPATTKKTMDVGPIKHPIASKVEKARLISSNSSVKSVINKSSKVIKEEAIAEALNKPAKKQRPKRKLFKANSKLLNIFSISIALIIVASYLVYISMPSISVRIASAQAGINATYPEYRPDGYSLSGPVVYTDGEVSIDFHTNTGNGKFVIKQSRSSWDSTAVKGQVNKDSKGEFITTEDHGLTIYTYNGNATWVNGGILYAITGNAHLSGDQIRRIAASL